MSELLLRWMRALAQSAALVVATVGIAGAVDRGTVAIGPGAGTFRGVVQPQFSIGTQIFNSENINDTFSLGALPNRSMVVIAEEIYINGIIVAQEIQPDGTPGGGVNLFDGNKVFPNALTFPISPPPFSFDGDALLITGAKTQFNGMTEIMPTGLRIVKQGSALPAPVVVTATDFADSVSVADETRKEQIEGRMVTLKGVTFVSTGDFDSGDVRLIQVKDSNNVIVKCYTPKRRSDLTSTPIPGAGTWNVTGVFMQRFTEPSQQTASILDEYILYLKDLGSIVASTATLTAALDRTAVASGETVKATITTRGYLASQVISHADVYVLAGSLLADSTRLVVNEGVPLTYAYSPKAAGAYTLRVGWNGLVTDLPFTVAVSTDGGTLTADGDPLSVVSIPPGAFSRPVSVTFKKLAANPGEGVKYELSAVDPQSGQLVSVIQAPVVLTLHYPLDVQGRVENTTIPAAEAVARLAMHTYDGTAWQRVGGTVDQTAQTVAARVAHLSLYSVMEGAAAAAFTAVTVAPNPFTPNGDGINDAATFYFDQPGDARSVGIYDLTGALVRELDGTVPAPAWDGTNMDGRQMEGGVYLWRAKSGGKSRTGTVILAR